MTAILNQLINQLNSSVFVLLAILGVVGWGLYRVGGWKEKFKHHDEKLTNIGNLAEKVVVLATKVDLIYQNTLGHKAATAAQSPINLTPVGQEIVKNINADDIMKKYLDRLTKEVESPSLKNAYDIQMAAMKLVKEKMLEYLDSAELAAVKQEAYNRGLLAEDIMSVFGVLLRDHILKAKGLPVSDVDKHTPPVGN